ncbi:hypothetical protein JR316_0004686 [Psilocybe cubensis]|uniref:Uncharacterized protein n=2 Tax=Psilocybe cubensis TaxID=181762 RepID=A0ACB8H3X8_PSICU|nr:hypothetical protein JR316_0004686 [Psilocybe cubensis]KAH9482586.1 hypothetical protein JR316_0004686 [Psilocybe cubensis]
MAIQFWSWIFIIQTLLFQTGCAQPTPNHNYGVLTSRALESVFIRGLTKAEKARNTYIALAIAASVVLIAGLTGLLVLHLRQKQTVAEPESAGIPAVKPHWWMVEGKNEKMLDWRWRLSHGVSTPGHIIHSSEGTSKIDRLRKALNIPRKTSDVQPILPMHRPQVASPTETLNLPMQTMDNIQPIYPAALERGYKDVQPPQIPAVTIATYDVNKRSRRSPNVPPKAIVIQSGRSTLSRSLARSGAPRSPAGRRWLQRNSFRHPFLPLKDYDVTRVSTPADPQLGIGYGSKAHESRIVTLIPAGVPPSSLNPPHQARAPIRKPAALRLLNDPSRRVRVGLPSSPRPVRASPRPAV